MKEFTPRFFIGTRDGQTRHWVVNVVPALWKQLVSHGHMYWDYLRFKVKSYVNVLQCYRCLEYGHSSRVCKHKTTCAHCGGVEHKAEHCPSKSGPARCIHCVRGGLANHQHSAMSQQCPVKIRKYEKIRSHTAYDE